MGIRTERGSERVKRGAGTGREGSRNRERREQELGEKGQE